MKKVKYEISRIYLCSELNAIFLCSKFIASILETAETMPFARKALRSAAQTMFEQTADLFGRIIRDYDDVLPADQAEQSILRQECREPLENNVRREVTDDLSAFQHNGSSLDPAGVQYQK